MKRVEETLAKIARGTVYSKLDACSVMLSGIGSVGR